MDTPPLSPAGRTLLLARRQLLRAQFAADVAAGTARPFVIPFDLLGTVLLPIIYLCVPHTRRPWLYRLRFAVLAAMLWLICDMMATASSTNFASAYMVGLVGVWGLCWGMTLLVWTRPQFEAERVERRRVAVGSQGKPDGESRGSGTNGHANGGLTRRYANGKANGTLHKQEGQGSAGKATVSAAPDETVTAALSAGYTYYWQSYPSDSPLLVRLGWVVDYATSMRGTGWSTTGISSLPSFRPPAATGGKPNPSSSAPVDLSSIPQRSATGYSMYRTKRSFYAAKLGRMALSYLILDLGCFAAQNDPYFIFGPDNPYGPPAHLSLLPPRLLNFLRSAMVSVAIVAAVHLVVGFWQVLFFSLAHSSPHLVAFFGARSDLWQFPDIFGGFATNVLDHGLAGFWGGWWHQTFRAGFTAPTTFLVRHGYLPRDSKHPLRRFVGSAIAFAQSGLLHGGGSFTALASTEKEGGTRWWDPPLFFMLSLVGVSVQAAWDAAVPRSTREKFPRWARRAANLAFVWAWLHATQPLFLDDLARAGVWLYEPVPISLVRLLGFGGPGDPAWRWERDALPRLWTEGKWWQRGLAV